MCLLKPWAKIDKHLMIQIPMLLQFNVVSDCSVGSERSKNIEHAIKKTTERATTKSCQKYIGAAKGRIKTRTMKE